MRVVHSGMCCPLIQRVLEHCTDEQKQKGIMEEILRSTCALAQDQYGNYVVQVSVVALILCQVSFSGSCDFVLVWNRDCDKFKCVIWGVYGTIC